MDTLHGKIKKLTEFLTCEGMPETRKKRGGIYAKSAGF